MILKTASAARPYTSVHGVLAMDSMDGPESTLLQSIG
jgi:hypothetical protein